MKINKPLSTRLENQTKKYLKKFPFPESLCDHVWNCIYIEVRHCVYNVEYSLELEVGYSRKLY